MFDALTEFVQGKAAANQRALERVTRSQEIRSHDIKLLEEQFEPFRQQIQMLRQADAERLDRLMLGRPYGPELIDSEIPGPPVRLMLEQLLIDRLNNLTLAERGSMASSMSYSRQHAFAESCLRAACSDTEPTADNLLLLLDDLSAPHISLHRFDDVVFVVVFDTVNKDYLITATSPTFP